VDRIMKSAILVLLLASIAAPAAQAAFPPEDQVVVVRVTTVEGLATAGTAASETRSSVFSYDGVTYHIDKSALGSLDGVKTLVLIDRRRDSMQGGNLVSAFDQEVRAFPSLSYQVSDLPGKVLDYQVATVGGNLRLLGSSDQIQARGGAGGPYRIWKTTWVDMVPRASVVLE